MAALMERPDEVRFLPLPQAMVEEMKKCQLWHIGGDGCLSETVTAWQKVGGAMLETVVVLL